MPVKIEKTIRKIENQEKANNNDLSKNMKLLYLWLFGNIETWSALEITFFPDFLLVHIKKYKIEFSSFQKLFWELMKCKIMSNVMPFNLLTWVKINIHHPKCHYNIIIFLNENVYWSSTCSSKNWHTEVSIGKICQWDY